MKKIFLFCFLFLTVFAPLASNADNSNNPKEFIEGISNQVVSIITSKKSDDAKQNELIAMFKQNVDTDFMGRFAMGKFFRQATPEQQKKFLSLYRDYVIYLYIPRFKQYSGEKIDVTQVIKDADDLFTVKSSLKTDKSSTGSVLVDYKVKKNGKGFKIIDIIGEGISLITTQRSDFATPLQERGVDDFIARLSAKVEDLKKNPPVQSMAKKSS
jgi:phospholipid transport system substrate-binding protein